MSDQRVVFRHVTLFHSDDGEEWCKYLLENLQQPYLRVETLNVDNLTYDDPPEIQVSLQESYLNLVLMTGGVFDYMESTAGRLSKMFQKCCDINVNHVMCVPCDIDIDECMEMCRTGYYDYSRWDFIELNMDGANVREICSKALQLVDVGERTRKEQRNQEKEMLKSSPDFCDIFPSTIHQAGERCVVVFNCDISGQVTMVIRKQTVPMKLINPYCAVCSMPEIPDGKHTAQILVDGTLISKCKMRFSQFAPSSIGLLMQRYNMTNKEDLDALLAKKYNETVCSDPEFMKLNHDLKLPAMEMKKETRFPSMIHWAAANGLSELCSEMMTSPGAMAICDVINCDNKDAADLAGDNQHFELEEYINDFKKVQLYVDVGELYVQSDCFKDTTTDSIYADMTQARPSLAQRKSKSDRRGMPPPVVPRNRAVSVPSINPHEQKQIVEETKMSAAAVGCKSQNELLGLMDEYKRGNFSITEIEMLFHSWKERYSSGHAASFKEKQRSLEDLKGKNKSILGPLKNKKMSSHSPITEEHDQPWLVSEPIVPRNPDIGLQSGRRADGSLWRSGTSTASSCSTASYDSGRGSGQLTLSDVMQDEGRQSQRKSHTQNFNDLRLHQDAEQGPPPPIPPRQRKRLPSPKSRPKVNKK